MVVVTDTLPKEIFHQWLSVFNQIILFGVLPTWSDLLGAGLVFTIVVLIPFENVITSRLCSGSQNQVNSWQKYKWENNSDEGRWISMNKLISSDLLSILSYTTRVYFSYASSILVYRRGEGGGKEIEEYLNISRFPKVGGGGWDE